jgi:hypothetical protein
MSQALADAGAEVVSTELHWQGCGTGGVDFLEAEKPEGAECIITNPPFKLAEHFIRRAISHRVPFALLLKSQYWHSKKRLPLFDAHKPVAVLPLTWRPDFHFGTKGGSPTMDCLWTVWGTQPADFTIYCPLLRPAPNRRNGNGQQGAASE